MSKLAMMIAALCLSGGALAADIEAMLKKADSFRMPDASAQLQTEVQTIKNGQVDKSKRYEVLVRPGGQSLVLFRSPGESGQKVLMKGDDFWMLMPGSARPIRITPLQKLLGDAATGDIATMTWAGDYDGVLRQETEIDGQPCWELDLSARRPALSYQKITLFLAKRDGRPLRADLYASSNRKLKSARYELEQRDGRLQVTRTYLSDAIQTQRETVIHVLSSTPKKFGDELFNPMYLSRSDIK
ncbi:outer membrane lipoprotein-sorting protein [Massilia sp. TS11]|uniref:outer membrane lipoprotein-sorting protein n=1 Tax=Massilia sp. TS11 TaxID=2908003 RepID=UPI001EDA509F|nr:outer membrane lipoprotein-sorting protein [Massilia sp. TS11]MCG2585699.1 outer membrane lipoprotein-sorting protein [Massilia sp. TS11]